MKKKEEENRCVYCSYGCLLDLNILKILLKILFDALLIDIIIFIFLHFLQIQNEENHIGMLYATHFNKILSDFKSNNDYGMIQATRGMIYFL